MNKKIYLSLILIFVSLFWGGSFIVVRLIVEEIPPLELGFLRFIVTIPIMTLILIFQNKPIKIPIKEIPSLSILGLTGVTLLYIFQYFGVELTTASTSAVLINTNIIFIAILSGIFLKEIFNIKKSIGIILSFSGVIIVIFSQMRNENIVFNNHFLIGCIFILLSAFSWSIYSIYGKKLLKKYDPFTVTTYAFILGTIFYIPLIFQNITNVVQKITFNGWLAIFYLAILCSIFGYVAWYYALTKIEAGRAAVFLNFIPFFAILFSFFIGEMPTYLFLIGAILIIYGVYLTQKS
jgi:drug/metabolite transporter (DMT)-like permease